MISKDNVTNIYNYLMLSNKLLNSVLVDVSLVSNMNQ